jgi:uncharacterized protein
MPTESRRACKAAARLSSLAITERIQADAKAAAKAKDRDRLAALRLLLDALGKEAKEARGPLDEQREIAVLKRERKRRAEAAEAYRKGGRADQADSEDAEAVLIEQYLPAEISDDELETLVADALSETGAASQREMGKVMAAVMSKAGGRADGRRVSELVRSKLNGP